MRKALTKVGTKIKTNNQSHHTPFQGVAIRMATRAWSEISVDEKSSSEGPANTLITPVESSEVCIEHWAEEPNQVVETVPNEGIPVVEVTIDIEAKVASEEEWTACAFWELLRRAGYTVW